MFFEAEGQQVPQGVRRLKGILSSQTAQGVAVVEEGGRSGDLVAPGVHQEAEVSVRVAEDG